MVVWHVEHPILPLMEDVDLLHHAGQDVVEAGQPQLRGEVLDNIKNLTGKIQTYENIVARTYL